MKAAPLSLIETLRFEPGQGFLRLDLHRNRMAQSAKALALPFSTATFEKALSGVSEDEGARRVRLELLADGTISLTHAPFQPLAEGTVWRVAIAQTRLSSGDPLLRHKTSRRDHYTAARAEFPAEQVDEVLLLNERGQVCEGTITSLFLPGKEGTFLTPALSCGMLAGILRQSLISDGKAREAVVKPDALEGRTFYLGNSLRGLIAARLA